MTTFATTTSTATTTVTAANWNVVYKCVHCHAWQEDHVDLVHCLFAPTDYTAPAWGEASECRYTGPVLPAGSSISEITVTGATTAVTGWAMSYTVKP